MLQQAATVDMFILEDPVIVQMLNNFEALENNHF